MKTTRTWTIGEWTFHQVEDHAFTHAQGEPLFAFSPTDSMKYGELYDSLEYAMVSAVAEKYTGPRGAGGTGVGTAADWFMRSIGATEPTREELIEQAAKDPAVIALVQDARRDNGRIAAELVIDALVLGRRVYGEMGA